MLAPARKPENEIALEPTSGGFGTTDFEFDGSRQRVRGEGQDLLHEVDDSEQRAPLRSLAEAVAHDGPAMVEVMADPNLV